MKKHRLVRILITVFLLLIVVHIVLGQLFQNRGNVDFGVTFSPRYASYLKLDWQAVYLAILDDLRVKNLRIPTYWNSLESERGQYDFSSTDFMLDQASRKGARVLLVVGIRQPRWPECHIPKWAQELSIKDRQEEALKFIQAVVDRYKQSLPLSNGERKDSPIIAFQVENEPTLASFGFCTEFDKGFLQKEISLVKSLSKKPVMLTDSGELGNWVLTMQLSDIFGTSLYREVYNASLGRLTYPIPPYLYPLKSAIIKSLFARSNKETMIVELQAEPWLTDGVLDKDSTYQADLFPLEKLQGNVEYARKTGFNKVYLWGVEWWYFMAQNGHPEYLQYAKTLFK